MVFFSVLFPLVYHISDLVLVVLYLSGHRTAGRSYLCEAIVPEKGLNPDAESIVTDLCVYHWVTIDSFNICKDVFFTNVLHY